MLRDAVEGYFHGVARQERIQLHFIEDPGWLWHENAARWHE